ncbi:MAG: hypothetical protein JW940_28330, partial [Polyangiaceae bacterium]|nr:hypothetical protein [Polyangiaceae bacterium]
MEDTAHPTPFTVRDTKAQAACVAFAKRYCVRAFECSSLETQLRFGELARCTSEKALWCSQQMEAPDSGFSFDTLSACARAVVARPCGRWRRLEDVPVAACHPDGGRRYREPCFSSAQCLSGFCTREPTANGPARGLPLVCGACAPVASANDVCADASLPLFGCPLGSICSRGTCIGPFADEGQPCGVGPWYV